MKDAFAPLGDCQFVPVVNSDKFEAAPWLRQWKQQPDRPIAAVLVLNTIANVAFPAIGIGAWLGLYLKQGGNHDAPGHFFAWLAGKTRVDGLEIAPDRVSLS
mgnify:CR=1 FL=1